MPKAARRAPRPRILLARKRGDARGRGLPDMCYTPALARRLRPARRRGSSLRRNLVRGEKERQ
jgi:hypothetical protein